MPFQRFLIVFECFLYAFCMLFVRFFNAFSMLFHGPEVDGPEDHRPHAVQLRSTMVVDSESPTIRTRLWWGTPSPPPSGPVYGGGSMVLGTIDLTFSMLFVFGVGRLAFSPSGEKPDSFSPSGEKPASPIVPYGTISPASRGPVDLNWSADQLPATGPRTSCP